MGTFIDDEEIYRYADFRTHIHSLKIVEDLNLPRSEAEDIAADLWAHLVAQLVRYDASRSGLRTFISRVVRNKAHDIFRSWSKGKHSPRRRTTSLNELIEDEDGNQVSRQDLLTRKDYRSEARPTSSDPVELIDQRIDLAKQWARLSEENRRFCLRLLSESISDIARSDGVTRRVVDERIREIQIVLGLIA